MAKAISARRAPGHAGALMHLPASARAWGSPAFPATLKRELADQVDKLPLHQALAHASAVADEAITVMLLDAHADCTAIHARVGVFFGGLVAGCSCADDPGALEPLTEYCELRLEIQREAGKTVARLAD